MSSYVAVLSCSLLQETLKATTYTVDILLSVEDRSGPIIIIESNVEVILFMSIDVFIRAKKFSPITKNKNHSHRLWASAFCGEIEQIQLVLCQVPCLDTFGFLYLGLQD